MVSKIPDEQVAYTVDIVEAQALKGQGGRIGLDIHTAAVSMSIEQICVHGGPRGAGRSPSPCRPNIESVGGVDGQSRES
jgi:hypothetical protein